MTIEQLKQRGLKEYAAAKVAEKDAKTQLKKVVDRYVDFGETLGEASKKFDQRQDFLIWVDANYQIKKQHVYNYLAMGKHKESARLLASSGEVGSATQIMNAIPTYKQDVELTEADVKQLGYVDVSLNTKKRNSDDWHTPEWCINAARNVMGDINLDPFSSNQANVLIKADNIYTEADNALSIDWLAVNNVWMNPPYGKGVMQKAVDKLLLERAKFKQIIVLTNAATDTLWFEAMRKEATSICLTKGRISFEDAGGKKVSGNTKGQAFFYFGENADKFCTVFSEFGWVVPGGVCYGS